MPRNSNHRDFRYQDIFDHDCPCADSDTISHTDASQDLGTLADIHIVTDHWRIIGIAPAAADAAVAVDLAILADPGLGIDDYGPEMLQLESLAEAAGADDEPQAGTEAVFAGFIPESEQFVRGGERIFLLLTQKPHIPADIILFRPDQPFEEFLFTGHNLMLFIRHFVNREALEDILPLHQGEVRVVDRLLEIVGEGVADELELILAIVHIEQDLEEEIVRD